MPKFNPPAPLNFDEPSKWQEWKQCFCRYRLATRLHRDEGEEQVSALIYAMGRQAENIYQSFEFEPVINLVVLPPPADPRNDFDTVLAKFEAYFVPKRNTIYERTKFYKRSQQQGESIECFVRNLHELAAHCRFGENESENIRDRLISGMLDNEMSQKLQLEQDTLTLARAIDMARHSELVNS